MTGEQLINGPMVFAIATYPIPIPDRGGEFFTGLQLQQSSLYAAVGSVLDFDTGGVDAGFAVDAWRPAPLASTLDVSGDPVGQMFRGVDIDVAVRNTHATLHRINYHMTLVGKIIFLAAPL